MKVKINVQFDAWGGVCSLVVFSLIGGGLIAASYPSGNWIATLLGAYFLVEGVRYLLSSL